MKKLILLCLFVIGLTAAVFGFLNFQGLAAKGAFETILLDFREDIAESVIEKDLQPGEVLKVDTGCIVGFTANVNYDIQFVGGIKNTLFGGEGLFFATLTGPGKVWIQTLPISRLAGRILAYGTYKRKEEGSILGGIGNILDGDGWK